MALDARLHTASVFNWALRLPEDGQEMAHGWLRVIEERLARAARRGGLSDHCMAAMKRCMVEDVRAQLALLSEDANKQYAAKASKAWAAWYPAWARGCLSELERLEPDTFVSEEEARKMQSARDKALNAKVWQAHRLAAVARDLLAYVHASRGQVVVWDPDALARALRPDARHDQHPRVRPLADMLVAMGFAEWKMRANGHPWALAATGKYPQPETT